MAFSFPAETAAFLTDIARNNERDWFEANRGRYDAGYVEAGRAFVDEMGPRLRAISPRVNAVPRINGSISRINRDTRFSKDKTPYKDHLDLWFWHGDKRGWDQPGFYLRVTADKLYLGSGMHVFNKELIVKYRDAVVDERSGKALEAAVAMVEKAGPYTVGGASRKTVPRGYNADHKRAGYLLHEGLYAGLEMPFSVAAKPGLPMWRKRISARHGRSANGCSMRWWAGSVRYGGFPPGLVPRIRWGEGGTPCPCRNSTHCSRA